MISPTSARPLAASMAVVAAFGIAAGSVLESGLPVPLGQWAFMALAMVLPALGWLIAARRPGNLYGWLLLATADCLGLGALGVGIVISVSLEQSNPLTVLGVLLASLFAPFYGLSWVFIPLFFPDGRLPSRRWRAAVWIASVAIVAHWLGLLLSPDEVYVISQVGNPLGITGPGGLVVAGLGGLGQLVTFAVALVVLGSLLARLRRSAGAERRQLRWMAAGLASTLGGFLLTSIFIIVDSAALWLGIVTLLGAIPAVIGVAVVRHNLLDIRVAIRGSRVSLVFDLRPTVDELLSELAPELEEAEPGEQLGRLAGAVRAALDARWAAVTLADGTRVVAGQEEGEPELTVPAGQGHIVCGPKGAGRFTGDDRRLLRALAVPVGLAIQSAGLAARLVNAQEAERRRIESNIHDGVQQQIVALIAGLELARATGGGPEMLALLRDQARQTLEDVRELAAGIHPSVLTQGGLAEALEGRCSRLSIASTVTVDPGLRVRRFSDEIEGAVYFTVSEAVANALKHARASALDVRLGLSDGRLQVVVADDGTGFDPTAVARRGLVALADRLAALGGSLDVVSAKGEGTRVRAWVPIHD